MQGGEHIAAQPDGKVPLGQYQLVGGQQGAGHLTAVLAQVHKGGKVLAPAVAVYDQGLALDQEPAVAPGGAKQKAQGIAPKELGAWAAFFHLFQWIGFHYSLPLAIELKTMLFSLFSFSLLYTEG